LAGSGGPYVLWKRVSGPWRCSTRPCMLRPRSGGLSRSPWPRCGRRRRLARFLQVVVADAGAAVCEYPSCPTPRTTTARLWHRHGPWLWPPAASPSGMPAECRGMWLLDVDRAGDEVIA
jgi:hypothetical protein